MYVCFDVKIELIREKKNKLNKHLDKPRSSRIDLAGFIRACHVLSVNKVSNKEFI